MSLRISVITPSFNQAAFLEATLRSVLDQQYPELEFLVLDGGSTDGSKDILERYGSRLAYWHSHKDRGQPAAINEGMRRATGELVTWINSDDLLLPGSLSRVARAFQSDPTADVIYGHHQTIDAQGRLIQRHYHPVWSSWIAWRTMPYISQPGTFFRRSLWEEIGGLDESLQCGFDYDLWYRFMRVGARFRKVPALLSSFRLHGDSKGGSEKWRARYAAEMRSIRGRYLDGIAPAEQRLARGVLIAVQLASFSYQRGLLSRLGAGHD